MSRVQKTTDDARELFEETERLRGALRAVTDNLAALLKTHKRPKGRSADDRSSNDQWWEDQVVATQRAYAALAGVSFEEWRAVHPGLYSPPPGPIRLKEST